MKLIYGLVIVLAIVVFSIWMNQDKKATNKWVNEVSFEGEITDVYYNTYDRMFFINLDTVWYGLIYSPLVELDTLIGCCVEKRINEDGVWIKNKGNAFFYKEWGGRVTDQPSSSLENIHRYIESKKETTT